jgi:perosamine synthetase
MIKSIMPPRNQFAQIARLAAEEVFSYYEEKDMDFGSQGFFEKNYTEAFVQILNPVDVGYADAVCSGTAAIFVAIKALQLSAGSEVLISSITDPGMVNPIILSGLVPRLVDNAKNCPYPSLNSIIERMNSNVSAIVLNHLAGIPISDIEAICEWAKKQNVKVIEDCSQAHMSSINNRSVGTFGDIACFSTMFSKTHSSGGRGGIVYTKSLELYQLMRMHADKGKPFHLENFNEKDPRTFLIPALNLNIDEISCAIGLRTLKKLPEVISKRLSFLKLLDTLMKEKKLITKLHPVINGASPFFWIFHFESKDFSVTKSVFAEALKEAGLPLNTHYPYIVSEWPWVKTYLADDFVPENAISFRDNSFNLLFNENFGEKEALFIVDTLCLIEQKLQKSNQ